MGNDQSMKSVPWDVTYRLGYGIDYVTGQLRKSILADPSAISTVPASGASSQRVSSVLRRVESKEDLISSLSIQLSGSVSASTPKGSGSGSFFGKFVDEVTINTYNLYFLLIVQVLNSTEFIRTETVDPALKTALPSNFESAYGDHYIVGVTHGGLYMGIIEVVTRTEEKKQEVVTKLGLGVSKPGLRALAAESSGARAASAGSGSAADKKDKPAKGKEDAGGSGDKKDKDADPGKDKPADDADAEASGEATDKKGAGASGSLNVLVSKIRKISGTELRTSVQRIGGVGPLENEDPEKMAEQARQFPELVATHGDPISAILKPYTQVNDLPNFQIDELFIGQYVACLDKISRRLLRAQFILDNMDYALEAVNRDSFSDFDQIEKSRREVAEYIGKLDELLTQLKSDPRAFLSGQDYAQRIPPFLNLESIPKRLRQRRTIAPRTVDNPRIIADRFSSLVFDNELDHLPREAQDALEKLGSFVAYVFDQIATSLRRIPWGFEGDSAKRLSVAVERVSATVQAVTEELNSQLNRLIEDVSRKLGPRGDRPQAKRNDADVLLGSLEADKNGRGGLAEHVSTLREAVNELKALLDTIGDVKPSDVVACDSTAWDIRCEQYRVAYRILGRVVHLGQEGSWSGRTLMSSATPAGPSGRRGGLGPVGGPPQKEILTPPEEEDFIENASSITIECLHEDVTFIVELGQPEQAQRTQYRITVGQSVTIQPAGQCATIWNDGPGELKITWW